MHQRVLAVEGADIEFVNADVIARRLDGANPDGAAFAAGRVMLAHLRSLAARRATFAFESTLASRTFAPFLRALSAVRHRVHLHHVWLRSASIAVNRVRTRVSMGGHNVPADVVSRRYARSVFNCRTLYLPIAHRWHVFDNSAVPLQPVADGSLAVVDTIYNQAAWDRFQRTAERGPDDPAADGQ